MTCRDVGPLDASILICGEAPGVEEENNIPFVGQSGILLKSMLLSAGIDYSQCYVTNICSTRPPGNNFAHFYEDSKRSNPKESLRKNWFELGSKIKQIKPRVVIALGAEPLRAITNLRGIDTWRGTRILAYDTKIIATYHPANILRVFSRKTIAEMDLRKAKRESEGLIYNEPNIRISPTINQVMNWFYEFNVFHLTSVIKNSSKIAFDIETIGKSIRCISFARTEPNGTFSAISIPFFRMLHTTPTPISLGSSIVKIGNDINYWSASDEEIVLESIASVLEDPSIKKIGQNSIHFDSPLIENEFGILTKNHYLDLMHAWHVLYPSIGVQVKAENPQSGRKGLKFISSLLTDHPNYWTNKNTEIDESEWTYNAMDSIVTLESAIKVEKELRDENLSSLYFDHVHPFVFALLKAEQTGICWDKIEADKMKIRLSKDLKVLKNDLNKLTGDNEFNPNSPKQVKELLYDKLGFPRIYAKGSKKLTSDENAIQKLQKKYPNEPALAKIIQFRKTSKLISTYVDVTLDDDKRVRCSYNASGTITGRIASSKTLQGTGMDLHNIPKGYTKGSESTRHLFKAEKGNIFVVGDLKQAEAMVVAWILKSLGDSTLYDLYHNPSFDIHRWCAALILGKPESEVTFAERQQIGKLGNHSGNYMSGPSVMEKRALKEGYIGFSFKLCKQYLNARLRAIPGLQWWWDDVLRRIRATRTLETCFGRRLHFLGRLDNETHRSAIAFEPQSTVGDVCNKMFIRLSDHERYWPILTTHDEIVLECAERDADLAANAMILASRIPLTIRPNLEPLIIPIEIMTGKNWGELEDWKGAGV